MTASDIPEPAFVVLGGIPALIPRELDGSSSLSRPQHYIPNFVPLPGSTFNSRYLVRPSWAEYRSRLTLGSTRGGDGDRLKPLDGVLACPLMNPKNAYLVTFLTRLCDFSDGTIESTRVEDLLDRVTYPPLHYALDGSEGLKEETKGQLPAYMYR